VVLSHPFPSFAPTSRRPTWNRPGDRSRTFRLTMDCTSPSADSVSWNLRKKVPGKGKGFPEQTPFCRSHESAAKHDTHL